MKVVYIVIALFTRIVFAQGSCPSDVIGGFRGDWRGDGLLITATGTEKRMISFDEFSIVGCEKFEIKVTYLNDAGQISRTIDLIAAPDHSGQVGAYTLEGSVVEGSSVVPMTGNIRAIQEGTLLLTFNAALGGQPAYFTELMNLTKLASGEIAIVRTLQIFAEKRGGTFLASRVTIEKKR